MTNPPDERAIEFGLKISAVAENFPVKALERGAPKDVAGAHYGLGLVAERKGELQAARRWGELAVEQFTRLGAANGLQESQELLAHL